MRTYQEVDVSPVSPSSTKNRMREKAFIGDDGSQVSRKGLLAVVQNPSQCEGFGTLALQMILNG